MIKILNVFIALLAATHALNLDSININKLQWLQFKLNHSKEYKNDIEESLRMNIFMDNLNKIEQHNEEYKKGLVPFEMAMNQFGDLLSDEFVTQMNGFIQLPSLNIHKGENKSIDEPTNVDVPKSIDWSKKGAVTEIKNQGRCGSCWAFSSTGALEGQHFRKTGALVSLSEQNLVDCSNKYGNQGCNGGTMDRAFQYVKDNGGIDTEESYPYEGHNDTCNYNAKNSGATDKDFIDIPKGDEEKLTAAIGTIGPISVAIDASHSSLQFYKSGIYNEPKCSPEFLNHAVLAVGYGTEEDGKEYYIVKNSWGKSWGEAGYVKMPRNNKNHCGIATAAIYPVV